MRGMDGFTVLQKKRQDREICDIPVIVVSASDPLEEPIMTNFLTATRSRGISFEDLTSFIHAFCELPKPPETSVESVVAAFGDPLVDPTFVDPTSTKIVSG
jgi:CheY-like chemotaxis protein